MTKNTSKTNTQEVKLISVENIYKAKVRLKHVALHTPLAKNLNLSEIHHCNLYLKREDLQVVRSYKIRGAYNKMSTMSKADLAKGVVCASAGNHAQGVAYACKMLGVHGTIFMPSTTPQQKVSKVKFFGKDNVDVVLVGDTYDAAAAESKIFLQTHNKIYIPAFDDEKVIEGQGTVGLEILEDCDTQIDYIFIAIGGGGLISGLGSYFRQISPQTKIIGVEPAGAAAMHESLKQGFPVTLDKIDPFVDGAAVKRVGDHTFAICREVIDDLILVPEGKVCSTILQLYNEEAIVAEPAGALTIAALDMYKDKIKGKNVVCVISGGNNDITRTEEIKERSLLYEGQKLYFIIEFPQRAGALREFLNEVLGPKDDITHFDYGKKHNRERGAALIGIEVKTRVDGDELLQRMTEKGVNFQLLNDTPMLFEFMVNK
jgi:threonine dehydratase